MKEVNAVAFWNFLIFMGTFFVALAVSWAAEGTPVVGTSLVISGLIAQVCNIVVLLDKGFSK